MKEPMTYITQRQLYSQAVNFLFNQMHASQGIKLFEERAVAALFIEYKQLDRTAVFGRVLYESLTIRKGESTTNHKSNQREVLYQD